jgi:pimeloyl-ACP methyl ester carboxylesterase
LPVLLLLHGSRWTLDQWNGVANHLKNHYRVACFNMPATGLSDQISDAGMAAVGSPEELVAGFLDGL